MSEKFNKYNHHIPWLEFKEYIESAIEFWFDQALNGEGAERDKASGRVLMLKELLHLPTSLDILEEGETENGEEQQQSEEEKAKEDKKDSNQGGYTRSL